jgi:hypothetical protein
LNKYIVIYPNPGNGLFNLKFNSPLKQNIQVSVKNILGETVWSKENVINNNLQNQDLSEIRLENQPAGIYYLTIQAGNQSAMKIIEISR